MKRRHLSIVKWDPDQPRIPKGMPGGGRWASGVPGLMRQIADGASMLKVGDIRIAIIDHTNSMNPSERGYKTVVRGPNIMQEMQGVEPTREAAVLEGLRQYRVGMSAPTVAKAWDPDQPRVPKGFPTGGQFASVIRGLFLPDQSKGGNLGRLDPDVRAGQHTVDGVSGVPYRHTNFVGRNLRLLPEKKQRAAAEKFTTQRKSKGVAIWLHGMLSVSPAIGGGEGEYDPTQRVADPLAEGVIQRMVQNMEVILASIPSERIAQTRRWYEGAHAKAAELVEGTKYDPDVGAAVLALLSPSANWFDNVRSAELVMDLQKRNPPMTDRDVQWVKDWVDGKNIERAKDGKPPLPYPNGLDDVVGKNLFDLPSIGPSDDDPPHNVAYHDLRAHLLRAKIQTEGNGRVYRPDLDIVDGLMVEKDTGALLTIQTNENLAKVFAVLDDPTPETLDLAAGKGVKVRSFYNNIRWPDDPYGDVTIDTHAFGAAVGAPYAAMDPELKGTADVTDTFGQVPKQLVIEAYRRMADEHGMFPREIQSVLWDAWQAQGVDDIIDPPTMDRVPESALRQWKDPDTKEVRTRVSNIDRQNALKALWDKVDKNPSLLDAMLTLHLPRYMRGEWP